MADGLARHKDQLAQALCVDTGRWRLSLMEVDALEAITHSRVNQAIDTLQTKRMKSGSNDISHLQVFVPYPVVGVISPWKFPLILSFLDSFPCPLSTSHAAHEAASVALGGRRITQQTNQQ